MRTTLVEVAISAFAFIACVVAAAFLKSFKKAIPSIIHCVLNAIWTWTATVLPLRRLERNKVFTLPTFNLTVNYWRFGNATTDPPDGSFLANLAWGKRGDSSGETLDYAPTMELLVPTGTDIRGEWNTDGAPDTVEVAAGEGWFYEVLYVDRSGWGFGNAHLNCVIRMLRGEGPGGGGGGGGGGEMLLEDGTDILLEIDGTPVLLE